jgi:sec-independent protein translocase protein TatB
MPTDLSFLGIGPLELLAILVLVLILFNPRDIANSARKFGRFINRVTRSDNFKLIQQTSREIQNLPARLAQEAELDDLRKTGETLKQDINTVGQQLRGATTDAAQQTAEAVRDAGKTAQKNLADTPAVTPPTPPATPDPYAAWKSKGPDKPA